MGQLFPFSVRSGLSLLLFFPDQFQWEYGCARVDQTAAQPLHPMLSAVQLAIALSSEVLYVLCLCSIWRRLHLSCYKLLFYIGIVDMLGMAVGAVFTALESLSGFSYCNFPFVPYIFGGIAMFMFYAETTAELILAVDRCMELLVPKMAARIFRGGADQIVCHFSIGNRTWLLLSVPTAYGALAWLFTRPVIFSVANFGFFLNPYVDYPQSAHLGRDYANSVYLFNNTLVVLMLVATYGLFCVFWALRHIRFRAIATQIQPSQHTSGANAVHDNSASRALQMTFLQVVLISAFNGVTSGLGLLMQYSSAAPQLMIVDQFAYLLTHSSPPFVYLLCNRTIRADVAVQLRKMFCRSTLVKMHGVTVVKPMNTNNIITNVLEGRDL